MNTNLALIDADVVVYAICNQAERSNPEGEPLPNVLHSVKLQLVKWITDAGGNAQDPRTFQLYLSGPSGTNFRFQVDPQYKANRPTTKPRYYKEAREYMTAYWGAIVAHGEADDTLARELWLEYLKAKDEADYFGDDVKLCATNVLVSVDKDLNLVPGWHYNPRKEERYWVTPEEGMRFFFKQMIMGDTVDNIKGVPFAGEAAAEKALGDKVDDVSLYNAVIETYATKKRAGEFVCKYEDIFQAADLLWMRVDQRFGHEVLLDLVPGHVAKAWFDTSRARAEAPPKPKRRKTRGTKQKREGETAGSNETSLGNDA